MDKKLILLTAGFPYGTSETFLENEISYLAASFESVVILCPTSVSSMHREIPKNCSVSFYSNSISSSDKISALGGLFNSITWQEIKVIKRDYQLKLNKGILSTLLISLFQAKKIARFCENKALEGKDLENTVLYSYWCDDTALALGLLKVKHPRLKCVSRTHGWDVYFNVHAIKYLPFRHFITDKLDRIFTISDKGKSEIENSWKVPSFKNILVSRLGVKRLEIAQKDKSSIFTLVSCSNVIPLKRVELIAQAVLACEDSIRWVHFGDGSELERIKTKCTKVQKENHAISFRGRVSNEEVIAFYETNFVDAFINVSTSEGIPVSIMEAMSFGIPCIATNVGGTSEIVNAENGVLLDSNPDLNSIQMAIKAVLKDESKRNNAFETWESKYNAEKNYTDFVEKLKLL